MLYNYESLINYINENKIQLIGEYNNLKINREQYINGLCKTENCDEKFNKSFRQLIKTGPYCLICAIENGKQKYSEKYKKTCKYNYTVLKTFCNNNNIELIENYEDININRDTIIKGKCMTDNCTNEFSRIFRQLIKINGYCFECCKEIGRQKIINTNFIKYGFKCCMQNENIKLKQKQTIKKLYNVDHISQLEEIKEQKKQKSLEKYGTEYVLQSYIIKNKSKITNIAKYGVENPQQNIIIKNKTMETNLLKYGYKTPMCNEIIKDKMIKLNILKYGVPHHSQNVDIASKMLNSSYNKKTYTLPSGKIINYQGYENFAFDQLINIENIDENDLITNRAEVPEIWYLDNNNVKRRHFVDIYIKSQNRCIEVKSIWTHQSKNNVLEKQKAALDLGYNYEIWIFNKKGNKI